MSKKTTRTPFEGDKVYHIYNRGNNREKIFYSKDHYQRFLELYQIFPGEIAETYCYCLIPNHFHILLRINRDVEGKDFVRQIRRWLITYAMSVNREVNRKGHLFTRPLNRIQVTDEYYLKHLIRYIHLNPTKHGITEKFDLYSYSSYRTYLSKEQDPLIAREAGIEFFNGDILEYLDFHRTLPNEEELKSFIVEEKR